jgi:hypothetical protein
VFEKSRGDSLGFIAAGPPRLVWIGADVRPVNGENLDSLGIWDKTIVHGNPAESPGMFRGWLRRVRPLDWIELNVAAKMITQVLGCSFRVWRPGECQLELALECALVPQRPNQIL